MNNWENNTLKIRFRLPNGEEFEAEGTREFIERERNYFLTLIGHSTAPAYTTGPAAAHSTISASAISTTQNTELYFWEKLLKEEGETVLLRHPVKLPPADVALLILAGARVLLKRQAYPALELARSLKACGHAGGRLDRMLAGEMQARRITAQGSKRSRTYQLTDSGFARAFFLAEKILHP